MIKRLSGALVLAALLLAACGCGGSAWLGNGAPAVTTVQPAGVATGGDRLPGGHVSDDEMRAALTRLATCVSQTGYEAELVDFVPGLSWRIDVVAPSEADAARAGAAVDRCSAQVAGVVDAYMEEHRLAPAEQSLFEGLVRDCLEKQGVQLAGGRSLAVSVPVRAGEQFAKCQAEALEHFR